MLAERTAARPSRTRHRSVLVPPTSRNRASEAFRNISAAAMPAAGPDSSVMTGRRRTSSRLITPPSLRMTIRGAVTSRARRAWEVISAVAIIRGRMLAFRTAVRVRTRRPYKPETSWVPQAGRPRAAERSMTVRSPEGSSTEKPSAATTAPSPPALNPSRAASRALA